MVRGQWSLDVGAGKADDDSVHPSVYHEWRLGRKEMPHVRR
jgi:hypothetical protein